MRARDLIEELVTEAGTRVISITFGPNMPEGGGYVTGDTDVQVIAKMKKFLTDQRSASQRSPDLLSAWVQRGYSIFVRNQAGQMVFYGDKPVQLDQQAVDIFGLDAASPIYSFSRAAVPGSHHKLVGKHLHGSDFGVP